MRQLDNSGAEKMEAALEEACATAEKSGKPVLEEVFELGYRRGYEQAQADDAEAAYHAELAALEAFTAKERGD